MKTKKIWALIIVFIIIAGAVGFSIYEINVGSKASEISVEDAEKLVNEYMDSAAITKPMKFIAENNNIKVEKLEYGNEKDIKLTCTVTAPDVYSVISPGYDAYLSSDPKKKNSTMFKSALDFKMEFEETLSSCIETAPEKTEKCTLMLYDVHNKFVVYADDKAINSVFGGINDIKKDIEEKNSYYAEDGTQVEIKTQNVKKGFIQCITPRLEENKPDTSTKIVKIWNDIKKQYHTNFVEHNRWKTIFRGLWVTLKLTLLALLIGIIIGFLVAFVRCTYIKNSKHGLLLSIFNGISQLYLTVTRGTPVVVQIMIIYFVIFMPLGVDKFVAAVICFGLNSGAYVAEIVRGGIMSVDEGQTEAGRSLGFGYMATMWHIVFPQAFKAVLPALANEFIVLLKETSIAFYIGLGDLMYAVNAIRAATYSPFMPLIAAALIYLAMVLVLSKLVGILERRLRNSDR